MNRNNDNNNNNNYYYSGPPQGGYDQPMNPQLNVYVDSSNGRGYGPGYGPGYGTGMGMRGMVCNMCGRRRCRCNSFGGGFGGPGMLVGRRQGLLSTLVGGAIGMYSDRADRKNEERQVAAQRRMDEDIRHESRERGLGPGNTQYQNQGQSRSRSAMRDEEPDRDRQNAYRDQSMDAARGYSEDESEGEGRGHPRDQKDGRGKDEGRGSRRAEQWDEELPTYQTATRK